MAATFPPRVAAALTGVFAVTVMVAVAGPIGRHVAPATTAAAVQAQEAAPERVNANVAARKYEFEPSRIEVAQNTILKIVFTAEDIPHSFTIDAYRIAKRAAPGQPVVFEFRADQAGTFPFYCNLTNDSGCRHMRGELVVLPAGR
jgi:cytochrome c oxidase subunit II